MLINIIAKVNGKNLFSVIDIPLVVNIFSLHLIFYIHCTLLCFSALCKIYVCYVYCHIAIFDVDVKVTNIAKKTSGFLVTRFYYLLAKNVKLINLL